jgi:hypothetical protein
MQVLAMQAALTMAELGRSSRNLDGIENVEVGQKLERLEFQARGGG